VGPAGNERRPLQANSPFFPRKQRQTAIRKESWQNPRPTPLPEVEANQMSEMIRFVSNPKSAGTVRFPGHLGRRKEKKVFDLLIPRGAVPGSIPFLGNGFAIRTRHLQPEPMLSPLHFRPRPTKNLGPGAGADADATFLPRQNPAGGIQKISFHPKIRLEPGG